MRRDRVEYRANVGGGLIEHELVDIFVAEKTPEMTLSLNPAEVEDVEWIDLYDLAALVKRRPQDYSAWLGIYLSEHMDRIFAGMVRA